MKKRFKKSLHKKKNRNLFKIKKRSLKKIKSKKIKPDLEILSSRCLARIFLKLDLKGTQMSQSMWLLL